MNTQAKIFVDLAVVDIIKNEKRFTLVYQILSHFFPNRFLLKIIASDYYKTYSICSLFPNVSWYEREAWIYLEFILLVIKICVEF